MKIVLERSGGFAAIPALSSDIVVDTAELPSERASELEQLVAAVRPDQRPRSVPAPAGAADIRTYRLIVDAASRTDVLEFTDLTLDPALDALLTWLEGVARGR